MIPMTPSSPACYEGAAGAGGGGGEEGGNSYWPAASVSPGVPLSTSGDEGAGGTKVRKPYTITKQRERWTEEEHQKFLEALKLYGRAWRRIEEHIGTKTAVQIRSHAQKFFSKIERDVTAGQQQGAETGVAQVIDIPPPRPKRKPTHPYPRKAGRRISEEECPLVTAAAAAATGGSISGSSGISTAAVVEGCSKSTSAWEQDVEDQDAAKDGDVTRAWGIPRPMVTGGSSPAVAANAATAVMSPVPVFPAGMPWARIFGGGMSPAAIVNPAMVSPAAMVNPTMVSPAMMMPWGSASNALENGGAVSAMAATMAAASAWWAMQGGMPPGLMHPAIGAMYMAGGTPPLAIPTPFLFPQCAPQEVTVAAVPCGEAKEVPAAQDDAQEPPSSSRSSAMRRAERAQRVKELKARRMGSGNHLLSVSSDIRASTSGTNLTGGQVTNGSESAVNSLSTGVPVKHGLVRKEPTDAAPLDHENRKRLRNDPPQVPNSHLEKVRSVSGSNNLSAKFTNIEGTYDEASPNDNGSCGSDNSAGGGQADGNGSRGGPSSNSSACGNAAEGNDRSGSSDGSSEATCEVQAEKDVRSSEEKMTDAPKTKTSKQLTFNEFLPVRKDEKPEASGSRLPRTASIDGDRKEVTERGQIAFQALFKRDTLPRTFSPPPGLALSLPSKPMNRSLSANVLEIRSPLRTRKDQDSAFNTWENLRGTCSASKVDRCESGVSIPSSCPTKSLEDLQSSERRRSSRKGRSHALANNWLQLAPTSSLDDAEEDEREEAESADSGVDEKQQQHAQESFVCKLDLFHQANEDDDGPGTIDVGSQPRAPLSLSVGTARMKNVMKCNSSSVSTTRTVKYSGVGFVPYQRASTQAHVEKL